MLRNNDHLMCCPRWVPGLGLLTSTGRRKLTTRGQIQISCLVTVSLLSNVDLVYVKYGLIYERSSGIYQTWPDCFVITSLTD